MTQNISAQYEKYAYGKILLEQKIGAPVSDFCYPVGAFNDNVINIVANSGYKTAVTTNSANNFGKVDLLRLNRLNIQDDSNFDNVPELK